MAALAAVFFIYPCNSRASVNEVIEEENLSEQAGTSYSYNAGTGAQEDPYQIATAEQLLSWRSQVEETGAAGQYFLLSADVDAGAVIWEPAGSDAQPFQGIFDGGGHQIRGLQMIGGRSFWGFVGYNKGVIRDLTLEGSLHITADSAAVKYVGSAAGFNAGVIEDVISKVEVSAATAEYVGGIAGYNTSGKWLNGTNQEEIPDAVGEIRRCQNERHIAGYRVTGGIVGENAGSVDRCCNSGAIENHLVGRGAGTGGIAGRNGNTDLPYEIGSISNCYNTGAIGLNGGRWGGSLCGWANAYSAITNCYVTGDILDGYDDWAPLFPRSDGPEVVTNCYSLEGIANCSPSNGSRTGIVRSREQMKSDAFLESLGAAFQRDDQGQNQGYPILRWQTKEAETAVVGLTSDVADAETEYYAGDTFRMEGICFYAVHEDGTRELLSPKYQQADKMILSLEDNGKPVRVTCDAYGFHAEAEVRVTVRERTLTGIAIFQGPAKIAYQEGETFDTAALKIRASYANGTSEIVSGGFSCDANGPLSPANKTVTVSYTVNGITQTDSFDVLVSGAYTEPPRDENGVYLLETAADLCWFSDAVSLDGNTDIQARLQRDIDARGSAFRPIGKYGSETIPTASGGTLTYFWDHKFQGTLDGAKRSVTLALEGDSNTALVGYADGAVLMDLTVKGSVKGHGCYVAGLVARNDNAVTLTGCANQAEISFAEADAGLTYVAGVIAMGVHASVSNCRNSGAVTSTGGIVGGIAAAGDGQCVYTGCVNSGNVTGKGNYVAGVAAWTAQSVMDCDNTGAVQGTAGHVGGIVGGSSKELRIEACSNQGRVTGGTMAGGIAGGGAVTAIKDCYNKGAVTVTSDTSASCIGGILGKKGTKALQLSNCYNTGKISPAAGRAAAGDLAGYASSSSSDNRLTITNCFYSGSKSIGSGQNVSGTAARKTIAQLSQIAGSLGNAYKNSCTGAVLRRQTARTHTYGNWSPKDLTKVGRHTRSCKNCKLTKAKIVNPKGTRITKLTKKNEKLQVTWKKQTVQTAGYQIQYAANARFTGKRSVLVKGSNKTTTTLKKIDKTKRHYVRLRTYQTVNGKRYYSAWSKIKIR